jgi:hypothetical protein
MNSILRISCATILIALAPLLETTAGADGQRPDKVAIEGELSRSWTDLDDQVFEARLVGLQGTSISLEYRRKLVTQPLALLSDIDITYVEGVLSKADRLGYLFGHVPQNDEVQQLRLDTAAWRSRILAWQKDMARYARSPAEAETAWMSLRSIRDPDALALLEELVRESQEITLGVALVESIAAIDSPPAADTIVRLAIIDTRAPIQSAALWALKTHQRKNEILSSLATYLNQPEHGLSAFRALQISQLLQPLEVDEHPQIDITRALVELLTYTKASYFSYRDPTIMNPVFLFPLPKRRFVPFLKEAPNTIALRELQNYTRKNFGYDRRAWLAWLDSVQASK